MFSKLKSLVFEDDGAPAQPGHVPPAAMPPGHRPSPTGPWPPVQPTQTYSTLNTAMVDAIRKATFSRNTALTALIAASDALVDIIPDPVMRLKAAHKTAGAGRSGKEISDAVAIHLNDVEAEEMRFGQMLQTKINSDVGDLGRKAEACEQFVVRANDEIRALQEKLNRLQGEIGDNTSKANSLRGEAQSKEHELRQSEGEFKAAAQAVRDELNGHKNTILSTLG